MLPSIIAARDPIGLQSPGRTPEQRLFMGVLLTAVTDAVAGSNTHASNRERVREDAYAWIEGACSDFEFVCLAADLEPTLVRERALAFIEHARRHSLRKRSRAH